MIKTHDGVLKNAIKTFLVFFYTTPVLPRCDVIIWTKFYKNANISSTTNGKLTKLVSNFRKFNNPSNELSLKWIKSTCRTWSVLIASGSFFEENYRNCFYYFKYIHTSKIRLKMSSRSSTSSLESLNESSSTKNGNINRKSLLS